MVLYLRFSGISHREEIRWYARKSEEEGIKLHSLPGMFNRIGQFSFFPCTENIFMDEKKASGLKSAYKANLH